MMIQPMLLFWASLVFYAVLQATQIPLLRLLLFYFCILLSIPSLFAAKEEAAIWNIVIFRALAKVTDFRSLSIPCFLH